MVSNLLLYIGSITVIIWGIAHLIPTKSVVSGFGEISVDNKRIITMEWFAEGITMCFIGVLVMVITYLNGSFIITFLNLFGQNPFAFSVYIISAATLLIMAVLTALTGARTPIIFFKICPILITAVAILFILGAIL